MPFRGSKCCHCGTNDLAKCISSCKSEENLEGIFSICVYFRMFQELTNSCVTTEKKTGRKLEEFQRTCALRCTIAGRIKVLVSISL